jgi:hypothetical protein
MLAEQRAILRAAVRDVLDDGREIRLPQQAAGDPRGLRGLPAVGVRGTSGAIRGTNEARGA